MGAIQFYAASGDGVRDAHFAPAFARDLRRAAREANDRYERIAAVTLRDRQGKHREFLVLDTDGGSFFAPMDGHDPSQWHIPHSVLMSAARAPVKRNRTAPSLAVLSSFVGATRIRTVNGEVPVRDLRPGDSIITADEGPQPLRWIGRTTHVARGGFTPIHIRAGALGANGPDKEMLVSPQLQILIAGPRAEALFGLSEVLVPASDLLDGAGLSLSCGNDIVSYYTLLMDRHQIIFANGACCESFHPALAPPHLMDDRLRAELTDVMPHLAQGLSAYGDRVRISVHDPSARAWLNG